MTTPEKSDPVDPAKPNGQENNFVTKDELNNFKTMFSEFTDVVSQYIDEDKSDRSKNMTTPNNNPNSEAGNVISKEEAEAHGFDEKQVSFMNNLVGRVAEQTAQRIAKTTVTEYDSGKVISTETQSLDNEAYSRFPDLNNKQSELYKMTSSIMERERKLGKDPDKTRPDFLLSATLRAKMLLDDKEKQKNNTQEPTIQRRGNAFRLEVSSTSDGIKPKEKDNEVSPERQALRKAFGTSA